MFVNVVAEDPLNVFAFDPENTTELEAFGENVPLLVQLPWLARDLEALIVRVELVGMIRSRTCAPFALITGILVEPGMMYALCVDDGKPPHQLVDVNQLLLVDPCHTDCEAMLSGPAK
jgi:hypothetical protein